MEITKETLETALKASERWAGIRALVGYVENGTDSSVAFWQDDATRDFVVRVGGKRIYHGKSIGEALDKAIEENTREHHDADWSGSGRPLR